MAMATELAVVCTDDFVDGLGRLSVADRNHVRETIATLLRDPRHAGLNAHRLGKKSAEWECYCNYHVRLVYIPADGTAPLQLWYVGQHQLVDKGRLHFAPSKRFIPVPPDLAPAQDQEAIPADDAMTFTPDAAWSQPAAADDADLSEIAGPAPLAHYPATYLRFIGVPGDLVPAVQAAPTQDDILALPGLPAHTQTILLDLFTNPRLAQVLFDPSRLLYRATLDSLEGFCEGRIKKLMLNLTPQQDRCVGYDQPGAVVLRGVAGSGKTTVGLYRAIARAQAGRRVLLLTYNTTLVAALDSLVRELAGEIPANLTIQTVDSCLWRAAESVTGGKLAHAIARDAEQHQCFAAAVRQVPGAAELAHREGGKFFENEVATVIQARGLFEQDAYRAAPRTGRGIAIGKVQRLIVWDVYQAYRAQLRQRNLNDYHEIAHAVLSTPKPLPATVRYDDIIIDETQDITLLKLRAAARLLASEDAAPSLWLLCDSAQTIYSRVNWWQEGDLPQPPHRLYLRRNHRNTLQIATAAAQLAAHNTLRERDMASIKPERATHMGAMPQVIACASRDQQEQWVVDRLQSLCDGTDFRYSDFAVLCQTNDDCRHVGATLSGMGIPVTAPGDRLDLLENTVKVLTCYSAKGLEFPVVFLFNAVRDVVPHRAALHGLEGEDLAREIERARALFYVAMTRAADMLYILTDAAHPSPFLAELGDTVQRETLAGA
jgi:superfamily I DNA/RNA helicase